MSRPSVVVLGAGDVDVDPAVPRESTGRSVEALLVPPPSAAIVAAEGEPAFFRASLAFERGVRRVVVREGAIAPSLLDELAARATELGGELFARGEAARYTRLQSRARHAVGAPPAAAFALAPSPAPTSDPMPLCETSPAERDVRCEEVAFMTGQKPVLYLVLPRRQLDARLRPYAGMEVVTESDRLVHASGSGERTYGAGDEVVHVFIGHAAGEAAAAATLWREGSSSHVEALGRAMGYPACCVRAFRAMASRRVNAAFPYVTAARTRALGGRFDPLLDVTSSRLVPFVPCRYDCPRALEWARAVADAAGIEPRAPRVVVYFDELRAITFERAVITADGARVEYGGPRWAAPDQGEQTLGLRRGFASIFGGTGVLRLHVSTIEIDSDAGHVILDRAGGLGVVLPFGESATLPGS